MRIIVYINSADADAKKFKRDMKGLKGATVLFFEEGASLAHEIKKGGVPRPIIVFKAFNREDLLFIHSLRDLIAYTRLILILPDSEAESVSLGHSLYPRFLTFADSDLNDVFAVTSKMIGNEIRNTKNLTAPLYSSTAN